MVALIIALLFGKRPQPVQTHPRRYYRWPEPVGIVEALDRSLGSGYQTVNWDLVDWSAV